MRQRSSLLAFLILLPLAACTSETESAPPASPAAPEAGASRESVKPPSEGAGAPAASPSDATEGAAKSAPPTAGAAASETGAPAPTPSDPVPTAGASDNATSGSGEPAVKAVREFIAANKADTSRPNWKTTLPRPPKVTFDTARTYLWMLETSEGPIQIKLLPGVAPMHVSSTIYLTELGFYDGLSFHRVIPGFMAQGGCPLGNGTGGPGYKYDGEFAPDVRHDRPGLLSMANAGPGTDGSQFFLTFVPTPHLDGRHTIFGEVVEGMNVLGELEKHGSSGGATKKPLSIVRATILVE